MVALPDGGTEPVLHRLAGGGPDRVPGEVRRPGDLDCRLVRIPAAEETSVWSAKKSSGYSFDSYLLSSSIPICSENPSTGASRAEARQDHSRGKDELVVAASAFDDAGGDRPRELKPSRAIAPVASGFGGVMIYRPARLSGVTACPSRVQWGFFQCRPPVTAICRNGLAWLYQVVHPRDLEPPAPRDRSRREIDRPVMSGSRPVAVGRQVLSPVIFHRASRVGFPWNP